MRQELPLQQAGSVIAVNWQARPLALLPMILFGNWKYCRVLKSRAMAAGAALKNAFSM